MNEPQSSIRIDSESDRYSFTTVRAVAPTWRDIWAILRGRYRPMVVKERRLTLEGASRELKKVYSEPVRDALADSSPFLERLRDKS